MAGAFSFAPDRVILEGKTVWERIDVEDKFSQRLYALVKAIPPGRVASCGQLALMLGHPRGARITGWAMARCQDPSIPCHRVVKGDGTLAPEDAFGIPGLQRQLLQAEGVSFLPDGRVDMAACRWPGPPPQNAD